MTTIDSAQNDTFKKLASLTAAKGLKKEGLLLLSGEDLIGEFLKSPHLEIHHELVTAKHKPLTRDPKKIIQMAQPLFDELDAIGTGFNLLVLEQPKMGKLTAEELAQHKPNGLELVAPIGDPGNLGALIRSAEAFGASRFILTEEAAHPFLPKAVKASAGSVLRLALVRGPALRHFAGSCVALDMGGAPVDEFAWPRDLMLAVGEEGQGLGSVPFKQRISIPTRGVESLNAVVAASIALAFRDSALRHA